MTLRKRWAVTVSLLACLGVGAFVMLTAPQPGLVIAKETLELLRPGLSMAEAEAIIGMPPGDYTTRPHNWRLKAAFDYERRWYTDAGVLSLTFDSEGKMYQRAWFLEPSESWVDRLRRLVGL